MTRRGRGQPPKPYGTRVMRVPSAGRQFFEAVAAAQKRAAERAAEAGESRDLVYLWCDPAGEWRVAMEESDVPERLNGLTEGFLTVWSNGEIGIVTRPPEAKKSPRSIT